LRKKSAAPDGYESVPIAYLTLTREGTIEHANSACARLLGLESSQLINQPFEQFLSPEQQMVFKAFLQSLFSSHQKQMTCTISLERKENAPLWLKLIANGTQGNANCDVDVAVIDVTEYHQTENDLRQTAKRYQSLIEHAPDGIVLVSMDGKFKYSSPSVKKLFGYAPEDALGADPAELTHPDDRARVIGELARLIAEPDYLPTLQYRFLHKNGSWRWIESTFSNLLAVPGVEAIVINFRDIDEQRLTHELLEKERNHLEIAQSIAHLGSFEFNPETGISIWSQEMFNLFAIDPAQGAPPFSQTLRLVHPDERQIFIDIQQHTTDTSKSISFEFRSNPARGEIRYYKADIQPELGSREKWSLLSGTITDITEIKRAFQQLQESETRYRILVDTANEGIWSMDGEHRTTYVNQAMAEMLGYAPAEMLGKKVEDFFFPEDMTFHQQKMQKRHSGNDEIYERRFRKRDGSALWTLASARSIKDPQGHFNGSFAMFTDITERKQAEQALRASEEKYRGLLATLDNVVAIVDYRGEFLYLNDTAAAQLESTPQQLTGKTMHELFPDSIATRQMENIRQVINEDKGQIFESLSIVKGQPRWYRTSIQPIHDENGQVVHVLLNSMDIHELKTTQQELQKLNQTLEERVKERTAQIQDLYDNAPVGYHSVNGQGNLIAINQTELNWLGYSYEELIEKHASLIFSPEQAQFLIEKFEHFKTTGKMNDLEALAKRKDGTTFPVLINAIAIFDASGSYVASRSTMIDITERKQNEAELQISRLRLESSNKELEAFAYSVSHDLRAPLRIIDGWSKIVLEDYNDILDEQGQKYLAQIRYQTQLMGQLINDLLQLSRVARIEMQFGPVNLSAIAENISKQLQGDEPTRRVEVIIQPAVMVTGDNTLLNIVLTNLLENAWKFTSKREKARIEFGETQIDNRPVYYVRDNGAGFDMRYVNKLFQAFQRLHRSSEYPGTGIGLATVQRIIHRHGGEVWTEAKVDQGATFYFTLDTMS
jgi:PAS domain S-box-containing protein